MSKADEVKMKALEEENKILKKQIEDQEKVVPEMVNVLGDRISNEIKKIRAKGKSTANSLTVTEKHDHKNISLWTRAGKRIGPMHPENAIQTLQRFTEIGIVLSSDQPTAEQIEAYKQTAEYKAYAKKEALRRATKDKSRRSGQMDRLSAEIAKLAGLKVEEINKILPQGEVGKK